MFSVVSSSITTGENLVGLWRPTFTGDGHKLYVFGGGRAVNDHLNVLDLKTGVWSHIAPSSGTPPSKRYGHTASLWNGKIIIFGGSNDFQEFCNDVVVFDLEERVWKRPEILGHSVAARYLHTATVWNDQLYVYGGFARGRDCTYVLSEMRILDLHTFKWSEPHAVPPRYNHSASLAEDRIYIFGGKDGSGKTVGDLIILDPSIPSSRHLTELTGPTPLLKSQHFAEHIPGGEIIVFGKHVLSEGPPEVTAFGLWAFSIAREEWRVLPCGESFSDGVWNYFTTVAAEDIGGPGADVSMGAGECEKDDHEEEEEEEGEDEDEDEDDEEDENRDQGERYAYRYASRRTSCQSTLSTSALPFRSAHHAAGSRRFIFLGNVNPRRGQTYDHFQDLRVVDPEALGIWHVPTPSLAEDFSSLLAGTVGGGSEAGGLPSDFSIIAQGGKVLPAHKAILWARWPHFRHLLQSGMSETTAGSLTLPEPAPVVRTFLTYLYTDRIPERASWQEISGAMVLGSMYLLSRLGKLCSQELAERHITPSSCGKIFEAAMEAHEEGLRSISLAYIFQNYGKVIRCGGLEGLRPETRLAFRRAVPDHASLSIPFSGKERGKVEGEE